MLAWALRCGVSLEWLQNGDRWAAGDSNPEPEGLQPRLGRPRLEPSDNTARGGYARRDDAEIAAFMRQINVPPAQLAANRAGVA
jgi:hypothetical protein